uniref:DENN/MADD domain containing 2Db n=1 Tax=Erpetoichthys calabaricus TaxID=27687 RepID=A0A8C4RPN6_ERPCA
MGDEDGSNRPRGRWTFSSLRIKKPVTNNLVEDLGSRGGRLHTSLRGDPRKRLDDHVFNGYTGVQPGQVAKRIQAFSDSQLESTKSIEKTHTEHSNYPRDRTWLSPSTSEKAGVMPSEGEAPLSSARTRFSNLFASFAKKSPNEEDNSRNTAKADDVPSRTSMLLNPIKVLKERSSKERQPQNLEAKNQEMEQRESRYASGQFFFEYLVVVSLKKTKANSYEPQVIYQFPKKDGMIRYQKEEEEKTLKAIMLFCFPEGVSWAPLTEYKSETFSFVLTEIDGSRKNGYCRRLLPQGKGARLPEAYCVISKLACFGLFSKIFDEVEKRRQISLSMIYPFMQSLRELPFPAPGHTVKVKSFIPDSGTEIIELTRPRDSQLEHVDFRTLFQRLSTEEVIYVFAATVLERRIIFVAEELSTLSQCIHAVTALLYPFIWQHTLIPIVPEIMIDVAMAPTPYLLGVQKQLMGDVLGQEEVLIVDLSNEPSKAFIEQVGDEKSLLPVKLQEEILQMLNVRNDNATLEELNKIVSEAFLHFFVRTIGHFSSFVKRKNKDGEGEFQKRSFYKSIDSKNTRKFVKTFLQTQMFDLFIQGVEQQTNLQDGKLSIRSEACFVGSTVNMHLTNQ